MRSLGKKEKKAEKAASMRNLAPGATKKDKASKSMRSLGDKSRGKKEKKKKKGVAVSGDDNHDEPLDAVREPQEASIGEAPKETLKDTLKDDMLDDDHLQDSQAQIEEGPPIGEIHANTTEDDDVSQIAEVITDDVGGQNGVECSEVIFNPEEFDVCFDDRNHMGTKEYLQVVREALTKFEGQDYAPPVYKAIKKSLKRRRFLIRDKRTSWREANKPEIIEKFGESFNDERRRKLKGVADDDSEIDSSLNDSAKQSDGSFSVGELIGNSSPAKCPTKTSPKQALTRTHSQPPLTQSPHRTSPHRSHSLQDPKSDSLSNGHGPLAPLIGESSDDVLKMAIAECREAHEYARPYDDTIQVQKGMAAEQKLAMLLSLSSSPNTLELRRELDKLEDLSKRIKYASIAPLHDALEKIEKQIAGYFLHIAQEKNERSMSNASNAHSRNRTNADASEEKAVHNRSVPFVSSPVAEKKEMDIEHEKAVASIPKDYSPVRSVVSEERSLVEASEPYEDEVSEVSQQDREEYEDEEGSCLYEDDARQDSGQYRGEISQESEQYGEHPDIGYIEHGEQGDDFEEEEEYVEEVEEVEEGSLEMAEVEEEVYDEGFEGSVSLGDGEAGDAKLQSSSVEFDNAHVLELDDAVAPDDLSSVGRSMRGMDFSLGSNEYSEEEEEVTEVEVEVEDEEEVDSDASSRSSSSSSDASRRQPSLPPQEEKKPNPKIEQFFVRLQHFLEVRRKVEERADIMDPANKVMDIKCKLHSGGIEKKGGKFKKEYQQHDLQDKLVRNLDDLYDAADPAHSELKTVMDRMIAEVKGFDHTNIVIPPLKPRDRAYQKAKEEYGDRRPGPSESWLYDIVRASVVCKSYKQMADVNKWLGKNVHIVTAKNRFANPAFNGYRDLIYHVLLPYRDELAHICEIQLHHKDIKALDEQFGLPKHYEYFRGTFAGPWRSEEATLNDLEMLNKHGDFSGPVMMKIMKSKDPDQLRLFAGICREYLGEFDKALELYRRVLIKQEESLGKDHESVAQTYMNLGLVLGEMGETDESLMHLQKALAIQESILGTDHLEVADSYTEIGHMLSKKGDLNGALKEYQKSRKIREAKLGSEHFLVISSIQNIGRALQSKGEFKSAVTEYSKALKVQQSVLGDVHSDVAATHALIGTALCQQGDFDRSMEEHRLALSIREAELGKNHSMTAESHTDIGIVLCQKGDYDIAEWRHRKALRIREAVRGKEHEDCAVSYSHLGLVLSKKGDFDGAMQEMRRSLQIREKNIGRDHPLTANCYVDMGNIQCREGAYEDALQKFRWAMVIRESRLGELHPDTADIYICLGRALNSIGEHAAALQEHRKALKIFETVLGKSHPSTATAYQCIADVLRAKGDKDEALIEHRKALAVRANVLAKDHPDTASSCTSIGTLLLEKGDLVGALVAFRQALAIMVGLCGEEHQETATAHIHVGRVLTAQEDLELALGEFRQAALIREAAIGKDSPDTAEAFGLVGSILSMQSEFYEAAVHHKKAYKIYEAKLGADDPITVAAKNKLELAEEGLEEVETEQSVTPLSIS
jgi:tetratricopeptide (TPR) repeat protein